VHQALELREEENPPVALRARYELGLDFRAAAMPRRATRAMEDCIAEDPRHQGALRTLCGLYEEQGRYAEAALAWERLEPGGDEAPPRVMHLWAEAATQAARDGDSEMAERARDAAMVRAPQHPHALIASALVAARFGTPGAAREQWLSALRSAPELASFVVDELCKWELDIAASSSPAEPGLPDTVYRKIAAELEHVAEELGGEPQLLLARAELCARFDPDAASALYREAATRASDALPARVAAARLVLNGGDPAAVRDELAALVGAGGALEWALAAVWRCSNCGSPSTAFFWRCDSCHQWGNAARDVGRAANALPQAARRERRAAKRGQAPLLAQDALARQRSQELAGSSTLVHRASSALSGVWRSVRREQPPPEEGSH
jgi:lipopolysaccharide biosynthesis regulator YciM